jgi:glycosyltransferase involved in cell wall biosynthesis
LLLESVRSVISERPDTLFLLVGGDARFIEVYRNMAMRLGVIEHVRFLEKIPAAEVRRVVEAADVLVSPRKSGTNTPLKIYSYLRSGKPIVATDLVTHTQVLTPEISILTKPDPASFARGILDALDEPKAAAMAARARRVAEEKYSYSEYLSKTAQLYEYVQNLKDARPLKTANSLV